MRAADLCAATGLTYRQVDTWVRLGLIHARQDFRGTGNPRHFDEDEAAVITLAARLVAAGMNPRPAIGHARRIATHGHTDLGAGLRITTTSTDQQTGATP